MSERIARGIAACFAALLTLAYFFLPLQNEGQAYNNSGRKKMDLVSGQEYSWEWSPEMDLATSVEFSLSGVKKAKDVSIFAEARDAEGRTVASGTWTANGDEENDSVRLEGQFRKGQTYALAIRAEGEGEIRLKGAEQEETGEFYPMLNEIATYETQNIVLLYFAAGALLAALTPVFGKKAAARPKVRGGILDRALPWATFFMVAGIGIFITAMKPTFVQGERWGSWDEEIHLYGVQTMNLFRDGGIRYLAADLITWSPGYAPMAVGYSLAAIFTRNADVLYHAAVGSGAVAHAIFCALAVKHAPRYKATFLVAGTLPTFIFLMTSVTYDTVVAGSILLGLALVLESADREEKVSSLRAITMVSLLAFGTVAKPAYSLALLSLCMIPADRFGGKREAWLFRALSVVMVAWCFASMAMPGAYDDVIKGDSRFAGTSVSGQLADMAADPLGNGLKPLRYVWEDRGFLTRAGIAHWAYLGGSDWLNDLWFWLLLVAAPVCTAGERWERKSPLTPGRRIGLGAIAVGAEVILAYAQYLASSEVGGNLVGLQARYFMPVWIAMALALMWPHAIRKRLGKMGDWMTVVVFLVCFEENLRNAILHMQGYGLL